MPGESSSTVRQNYIATATATTTDDAHLSFVGSGVLNAWRRSASYRGRRLQLRRCVNSISSSAAEPRASTTARYCDGPSTSSCRISTASAVSWPAGSSGDGGVSSRAGECGNGSETEALRDSTKSTKSWCHGWLDICCLVAGSHPVTHVYPLHCKRDTDHSLRCSFSSLQCC